MKKTKKSNGRWNGAAIRWTRGAEKYETDERYRFNDRFARTLYDNNHEVINEATGSMIFSRFAWHVIETERKHQEPCQRS